MYVIQVRDLVRVLQEHPGDAECVAGAGRTEYFAGSVQYGTESGRRRVKIELQAEDRVDTLEGELAKAEEDLSGAEGRNEALKVHLRDFQRLSNQNLDLEETKLALVALATKTKHLTK